MALSLSLSLSRSRLPRALTISTLVFLICLGVGFLSGAIFRENQKPAEAASASIAVVDNNQTVNTDQSNNISTIVRTSTVTIIDSTATLGYSLSAKLSQNTIAGSTVTIYPSIVPTTPNTSPCAQSSPCTLPQDDGTGLTTPMTILETADNTAATSGSTIGFIITITAPANTPLGNYIVDIEYAEEPNPVPPVLPAMQLLTNSSCPVWDGDTSSLINHTTVDLRNGQIYYVAKMGDNCWMLSNLRYAGGGDNTHGDAKSLTVRTSGVPTYTAAEYMDPGGSTDYTDTTPSGGFYGYLYNWCAVMGGQPNGCNNTEANEANLDTTVSICPAGWRLPTVRPNGSSDWDSLNDIVVGDSIEEVMANFENKFLPTYPGVYGVDFDVWSPITYALKEQGSQAFYASPNITPAGYASWNYYLPFIGIGSSNKNYLESVRCIL